MTGVSQNWLPELVQVAVSTAQQGNWAGPCPSQLLPLPSRCRLRCLQMGTCAVSLVTGPAPCMLSAAALLTHEKEAGVTPTLQVSKQLNHSMSAPGPNSGCSSWLHGSPQKSFFLNQACAQLLPLQDVPRPLCQANYGHRYPGHQGGMVLASCSLFSP